MQNLKIRFSLVGLCFFFLFSGYLQAAESLIEEVKFYEKDGNSETVTFHLNGPYLPKVFALKGDKPRVVFDFMDTRLARTVPASIDAGGSMIHRIRLGRYDHKTRAVIDLVVGEDVNFEQTFDEAQNILTIQLFSSKLPEKPEIEAVAAVEEQQEEVLESVSDSKEVAEAEVVEEVAAENVVDTTEDPDQKAVEIAVAPLLSPVDEGSPSSDPLLSSVTFENTSNKGEMVFFKLNGFYPPVVSGEEDGTPKVICDFAGTRLAESVVKELASDGKYISRVRVEQLEEPDMIRVTLDLVSNKNYDLQQVFFKEDNLFVIIVNSYDALTVPADSKE
jgi:AMIN domain